MTNETILSPEDIAAGWKVHDGSGRPFMDNRNITVMFADGTMMECGALLFDQAWNGEAVVMDPDVFIVAYLEAQPVAEKAAEHEEVRNVGGLMREFLDKFGEIDPNAAMIQRDKPKPYSGAWLAARATENRAVLDAVDAILPDTLRVASARLLTVAPISVNGFGWACAMWGADHQGDRK